jgi:hypothetical protein
LLKKSIKHALIIDTSDHLANVFYRISQISGNQLGMIA